MDVNRSMSRPFQKRALPLKESRLRCLSTINSSAAVPKWVVNRVTSTEPAPGGLRGRVTQFAETARRELSEEPVGPAALEDGHGRLHWPSQACGARPVYCGCLTP